MANPIENYDDEHWIELGKRVNDPEAARLIVNFLDGYPALRGKHSGLYLLAAEVIHRAKVTALIEAMQSRPSYRFAKFFGKSVNLAYRCIRLALRAALTGIAQLRKDDKQAGYNCATVIYPSKCAAPSARSCQSGLQLSNLVFLFRARTCGKCGAPVGQRQGRCEECSHVLEVPAVGQAPVQA